MERKQAREFMMKVFFQMDALNDYNIDNREDYFKNADLGGQAEYCKNLYSLVCNKKEEIDEKIEKHSKSWTLRRMPKTAASVLRLAACEILYMDSIPAPVSINEAVEMAKVYGDENAPSYVNAILRKVADEKGKDE